MKYELMAPLWFFLSLLFVSCGDSGRNTAPDPVFPPFDLPYDLTEPERTFRMPHELEEISGLGISSDGRYLIAIQDEEGIAFFIDKETGKVKQKLEFWKDGDYEGIEMAGDEIFAVKSSGTLYCVTGKRSDDLKVEKINPQLGNRNDVEGLAYDSVNHRLLLACKGLAGDAGEYRFHKAIYAFDLATRQIDSLPTYLISLEDVQAYLKTDPATRKLEKLLDYFSLDKSEFVFSPSGIAVQPGTGNMYITSSVGKLLMVLAPNGQILHIEKLKKSIHPQPEGICFDRNGNLYIASEGRGEAGTINMFSLRGGE